MFAIEGDYPVPCSTDPDLFFSRRKTSIERAKALCGACRIQLICLHKALEYEQLSGEQLRGVQGGLTEAERQDITLTRIA